MSVAEITHEELCYLEWLERGVCDNNRELKGDYSKLFMHLFRTPFTFGLMMDENRFNDGIELRYDYGRENDISNPEIASTLDRRDCSVLEMMIALSIKCEHIMQDSNKGFDVGTWFWGMIHSLGLQDMHNINFDGYYTTVVIDKFLAREYKPNGEGGLFIIDDVPQDLRHVDIWCQACWYMAKM